MCSSASLLCKNFVLKIIYGSFEQFYCLSVAFLTIDAPVLNFVSLSTNQTFVDANFWADSIIVVSHFFAFASQYSERNHFLDDIRLNNQHRCRLA